MSVIYKVKGQGGESQELSAYQIMAQANQALAGSNKSVMAITPDGLHAQVMQDGKQYTVPVENLIKGAGLQMESVLPPKEQTAYDSVNPGWRFAIANLEDDAQRKAYIEAKVKQDLPQAQVIGSGRDWYAYDAGKAKWVALTNSPDWDLADLAEGGREAAGLIGGTIGAIGGGAAGTAAMPGVGTIAGAMGGGAAGTAAGETFSRGIAALDPDYRNAFDINKAGQDVAMRSMIGGIAPGAGKIIGGLASKAAPVVSKALSAPASTGMKVAGSITENVGNIAQMAELGTTGVGKTIGSIVTPGLSGATMYGSGAMLPKLGVQGANWVAKKLGGGVAEESAEGILGGLGKAAGRQYARAAAAGPVSRQTAANVAAKEAAGQQFGKQLGRGLDSLSKGGEGVVKASEEAFGLGSRVLTGAGRVAELGGKGLQTAGQTMSRVEPTLLNQAIGRYMTPGQIQTIDQPYGSDEMYGRYNPGIPVEQRPRSPQYRTIDSQAVSSTYPGYIPYDLEI